LISAQNDPLQKDVFPLDLGPDLGDIRFRTEHEFPRFRPASRPATGGLCCFWVLGLRKNWKRHAATAPR